MRFVTFEVVEKVGFGAVSPSGDIRGWTDAPETGRPLSLEASVRSGEFSSGAARKPPLFS